MKQKILSELEQIQTEHVVKVVYACESGSRAWGFPSSDSDFDVRFLYLHRPEWYLSVDLEAKRDVIERLIDRNLDISGWDLRKALKLYHKTNPPLLEWLGSPIIYLEPFSIAQRLRDWIPTFFNPAACMYHYLHMARDNYGDYLKGEQVWLKKYFYALRPILAINWLQKDLGVVPTEFEVLVDKIVESEVLRQRIAELVATKREGQELGFGPKIPEISEFLASEMARLEAERFETRIVKRPMTGLNKLFRAALEEVWG